MFIGCQFSLYPMTDNFVEVILNAVEGLHERKDLRVETDDLSTLVVGAPDPLFTALEDCFLKAAAVPGHLVMAANFSRGCPGEPDDLICHPTDPSESVADEVIELKQVTLAGVDVAAQFALYPLGNPAYMDLIYQEITTLQASILSSKPKNFCTRADGDVALVFAMLRNVFARTALTTDHVVITVTISKGSPTSG